MNQGSPRQSVLQRILSVLTRKASEQVKQQDQQPHHPAPDERDAWRAYWEAQGQPGRTEPEIDDVRQAELAQWRETIPNIEKGIYPFKGKQLSRADVEWLLATHENKRGPVDWSDESQRNRKGLDVRAADLRFVNLQGLPLARLRCGLAKDEQHSETHEATEEECIMARTHMEGATLVDALRRSGPSSCLPARSLSYGCPLRVCRSY